MLWKQIIVNFVICRSLSLDDGGGWVDVDGGGGAVDGLLAPLYIHRDHLGPGGHGLGMAVVLVRLDGDQRSGGRGDGARVSGGAALVREHELGAHAVRERRQQVGGDELCHRDARLATGHLLVVTWGS